jgi:DNA-directed RNA polymerase specialized sigma subunit
MQRKLTDQVQLKLRFDEKLRRKLERAAERNDRSMNAEIVHRLERSLQDEEILTEIRNELAAMKKAMMEMQEEQFEKLFKKWKKDEAEDMLADFQRDDPDTTRADK